MAARKKEAHQLTTQDLADILSSTLELLIEHGHVVKSKDMTEAGGVMVYVSGMRQVDGQLKAVEHDPA